MRLFTMRLTTMAFAICITVLLMGSVHGCKKSEDKKSDSPTTKPDGGNQPSDSDGLPHDEFGAQFEISAHTESPYGDCEGEMKDVEINRVEGRIAFYQHRENILDPTDQNFDLWMRECSSESECSAQVTNMVFDERDGDSWVGVPAKGVGDSAFEPGKCSFNYTIASATLDGDQLIVVRDLMSAIVDPIDGSCTDLEKYVAAHLGSGECTSRTLILGTKVSDELPAL